MTGTCDICEKTRELAPNFDGDAMLCGECHLAVAIQMVADDTRKSYPDLTDGEAIGHVRNTIHPDDIDGDDALAEAYRIILTRK